ncbi:phosphatidylglycerophosphatase A family protein [Ideonella alba]|uniref:Phosphatidylglycerophosphatase A n=1 Tax=Ideonella alba TaxID=2824118 RepID=A0A940Y5I9_9BURK|nr:phosphatidylglycerophosphatase A [Ideonella alba]MBQ0930187.1 phosphatidylglycerophosphatase A [Ideonella alba]
MSTAPEVSDAQIVGAPRRADWRLLLSSPLHFLSLGAGSGLAPMAPGTVGTLWAWVAFHLLEGRLDDAQWAVLLLAGFGVGWWACTRTAQAMRTADPGAVVWDEWLAIWLVLWVVTPAGWWTQLVAFALFRLFDAAKPGPVGWADRLFKARPGEAPGWRQGFGILFDDLVAAFCTLIVMALWRAGT